MQIFITKRRIKAEIIQQQQQTNKSTYRQAMYNYYYYIGKAKCSRDKSRKTQYVHTQQTNKQTKNTRTLVDLGGFSSILVKNRSKQKWRKNIQSHTHTEKH